MAKTPVVFLVGTIVTDPADEAAFNEWYNKTHIPEVTSIPGVMDATRYEILEPEEGYPKFLAIYNMDGEEGFQNFIDHTKKQRSGEVPKFTPGPAFKATWRKAYRRIGP
jgi:hypothetical protein